MPSCQLRDPRSDSWPLMSSIWPTTFICIAYVYIVKVGKRSKAKHFTWHFKVAGPNFMKNREPYNIKGIMIAYNLFQVTFTLLNSFSNIIFFIIFGLKKNCYLNLYTDPVLCLDVLCELDLFWILPWQQQVQLALWAGDSWIEAFSFDHYQVDYSNSPDSLRILSLAWWYFFSKFVDLLDTFFFVARYTHDKGLLWTVWYLAFCEGRSTAMCRLCTWSTIAPFPGSPGGDQSEFLLWIRCRKSVFFLQSWMMILKEDYDGVMKSPLMSTDLLGVVKQHLVPS